MSEENKGEGFSRRRTLGTLGGIAGAALLPAIPAFAQPKGKPIRIGFQVHRTGIGATYGRWYERTTTAAVKAINAQGGIAGRPVEIVAEDDGTDPKRGPEVVEKLARQHKVDFVYGTLFSHVVIASAPRAGELKIPYFVVSEGYHVASGKLNRYVFQPGITDVRAQVTRLAEPPDEVLDHHDRRVHDEAEVERAEAHEVCRHPEVLHQDEPEQGRQRDHRGRDE